MILCCHESAQLDRLAYGGAPHPVVVLGASCTAVAFSHYVLAVGLHHDLFIVITKGVTNLRNVRQVALPLTLVKIRVGN